MVSGSVQVVGLPGHEEALSVAVLGNPLHGYAWSRAHRGSCRASKDPSSKDPRSKAQGGGEAGGGLQGVSLRRLYPAGA